MRPRIGSAGQVTHQPTTVLSSPKAVRMFQSASVRRSTEATMAGSELVPRALDVKSSIPCTSRACPVATVVQIAGDFIGLSERRRAWLPRAIKPASTGSSPRSSSGSITLNVAPSIPTSNTRTPLGRTPASSGGSPDGSPQENSSAAAIAAARQA